MIPFLIRHGTLYVMWSSGSSAVPFFEFSRAPELRELDFGWLRVHVKIDWRPKGWDAAAHREQYEQWLRDLRARENALRWLR